jgi:tetratricopeptide (TPR) repeat protein
MGEAPPHDLLSSGSEALAEADWQRARTCFEMALELGQSVEALEGLARALQWLGEYDDAVRARERAFTACTRRGMPLKASDHARALAFLHAAVYGNEAAASGWVARAERLLEGIEESPQHG